MPDFFTRVLDFFERTGVPEQVSQVDVSGLFANPYFMGPFLLVVCYLLYKQAFTDLAVLGIAIGMWIFSGSSWMEGLTANGELQIGRILPVAGVWLVALMAVVYLLFMRSD